MRSLTIFSVLLSLCSFGLAKDDSQVADLVKQHLDSIGTNQARTAVKNRAVEGSVEFQIVNQSSGKQDGREVFISEADKLLTLLKFSNPNYHGERLLSDGKKTSVANTNPGSYSSFGRFVVQHPEILTEGLWGGTLSTAWPLLELGEKKPRLQDLGLKKVDSRELREMRYVPSKHSDLDIVLYFDPQTFRHVMTTYTLEIGPQIQASETANAGQDLTRYRLEERFDDVKETDGLSLPAHWVIQFAAQVPQDPSRPIAAGTGLLSRTGILQFDVNATGIRHNVSLDPKNFDIK